MTLIAAKREERLKQRLTGYERYHLLLIDELATFHSNEKQPTCSFK